MAVAAGGAHTCARTTSGLYCWGGDVWGELGDGIVDWLVPRGVNLPCP
jgi:alpha-tubulin suppressor-like RCC1 family protein